jgi:hypothetical protein
LRRRGCRRHRTRRPYQGARFGSGESIDIEGDLRLNFSARHGRWSFETAYQLFALHGDSIEWTRDLGDAAGLFIARLPNDERRLFNLTDVLHDKGRNALVHRIDRLAVGYTSEKAVLRFGRQALSWGNGLFYSPMDLVNPFDPAAIDTEFKSGDDMLYGQYLRDNGDDLQAAVVFRRDVNTGDVEAESGTSALKYHGFAGNSEFDLLVASNYGDAVLGVGGLRSIGGAVWRSDIVVAATDDDTVPAQSNTTSMVSGSRTATTIRRAWPQIPICSNAWRAGSCMRSAAITWPGA